MRSFCLASALALVGVLAACGGKVFVDTPGNGGNGGSGAFTNVGGSGAGTTQPTGMGGGSCFQVPPASQLSQCGGGVTSGTGGPLQCDFFFCDTMGNTWDANCTGSTCQCLKNGALLCTCALNNGGDVCSGLPNCCGLVAGM